MPTPAPLSVYVLTHNSETYLDALLSQIAPVADELLIVDSGSTDQTAAIARRHGCCFIHRALDNFRDQREFALRTCRHRMVLMLDSDEIPDGELVAHIAQLKQHGFTHDAYQIQRHWYVRGRPVTCMYPVESPDWVVRLVNRDWVTFVGHSRMVHERPLGYRTLGRLRGAVAHYTFETPEVMERKLIRYSTLAARDLLELGVRPGRLHAVVYPPIVWAKWYVVKGGWKDGRLGWVIGRYVWRYVYRKFSVARRLSRAEPAGAAALQPAA